MGAFTLSDTSAAAEELVVERWRAMSARERLETVASLNEACDRMAEAGVRRRHPSAGTDEVRLRVIALRLGRDLMVDVYGWDPDIEGW
jgi:hypothetical protein